MVSSRYVARTVWQLESGRYRRFSRDRKFVLNGLIFQRDPFCWVIWYSGEPEYTVVPRELSSRRDIRKAVELYGWRY